MVQILVVEDDMMIGMLLASMLRDMDLEVCAVETTQDGAIEQALRLRPDLMLVDARLGRGSGIAAMAHIQRHGAVPHIFMSGERLPANPDGVPTLLKPFTEQQLAGAIRQALGVSAG